MAYVFREKINLSDLFAQAEKRRVLVLEGEDELRDLYIWHLTSKNYEALACSRLDQAFQAARQFFPHLLLLGISEQFSKRDIVAALEEFTAWHPAARILTVGQKISSDWLKVFMAAGVSGCLERAHSRPQDITSIINGILHY